MSVSLQDVAVCLGKLAEDVMGRPIGTLIGITADIRDQVESVQITQKNGDIESCPIEFVRVINGRAVLLQPWRVESEQLVKELDIVKRKSHAVDLLFRDGDIDQAEYNELRQSYQTILDHIKGRRESILDTMKKTGSDVDQKIKSLQTALTNSKMLYTAREIDESTYQSLVDSLRSNLQIARKERSDIEGICAQLERAITIDPPMAVTIATGNNSYTSPSSQEETPRDEKEELKPLPIPRKVPDVVVIRMKEPSQA